MLHLVLMPNLTIWRPLNPRMTEPRMLDSVQVLNLMIVVSISKKIDELRGHMVVWCQKILGQLL